MSDKFIAIITKKKEKHKKKHKKNGSAKCDFLFLIAFIVC